MAIFYQSKDGYVGDVIPFYWKGKYHAFYIKAPLHAKRQVAALPPGIHSVGEKFWLEFFAPGREAVAAPYGHLVSNDLIHWEELPLAVQPGKTGDPDAIGCCTGSFIEHDGVFHLFYAGYVGDYKPQTICHATSIDLLEWRKDPLNPIFKADPRWYEPNDWRDPIVFWNEEEQTYWMVITARVKEGPSNRRGCLALAVSPDLKQWEIRAPFWSPHLHYAHECPDIFRWGDRWVLIYSEFSDCWSTHYRVSDSLRGPWLPDEEDTLDGSHFYAAKTASDGKRRFLFGWSPTNYGRADKGLWEFGGNMVIHELVMLNKGSLAVRSVPEIDQLFHQTMPLSFQSHFGNWKVDGRTIEVRNKNGAAVCTVGDLPECCRVTAKISLGEMARACGLLIYADAELDSGYQLRWEPGKNRIVFDRWPRPGNEPFMLERFVKTGTDSSLELNIHIDGTIIVAYLNQTVALTHRIYDHRTGKLGLFVTDGGATFSDIQCYV